MLTISAPIEIKAKTSYINDPEAFYHRIVGGYSLMETKVGEEDLLHIASTPPEIYVSEGEGMTSIVNQNQRNEVNLQKVDILNNVLNRIVASASVELTYQDRVFITDALYKLGIKDDRKFMNAFYRMAEETQNTNTLINLYLQRGGELKELVERLEERQRAITRSESILQDKESVNNLCSNVFNRLGTGEVYQIVSNFNRSITENELEKNEYSLSDQTYTAQHILLSMLRERAGVSGDSLTFLNNNTYEETIEDESSEVSNVRNEITAAVLMDMLKNIYHTAYDKFYNRSEAFYSFEDTFFKSSDQTFLRIMGRTFDEYNINIDNSEYTTENNRLTSTEIELLAGKDEGELTEDEARKITETVNEINIQNEKRRQEYVRAFEQVRQRHTEPPRSTGGFEQTRKDAILALSDPEKLREELEQREERRVKRQNDIIREVQTLFPDQSSEIYQLINEYYQGDTSYIENNFMRPAEVGELIYDINEATSVQQVMEHPIEKVRDRQAQEFLDSIKKAREEEGQKKRFKDSFENPVETIHRTTQTLTSEELNDQISLLENNISRKIDKEVRTETQTETNIINNRTIETNQTINRELTTYDIEKMIENGVKSQMGTISNQVIGKLERQMRNEKIRRGYQ